MVTVFLAVKNINWDNFFLDTLSFIRSYSIDIIHGFINLGETLSFHPVISMVILFVANSRIPKVP